MAYKLCRSLSLPRIPAGKASGLWVSREWPEFQDGQIDDVVLAGVLVSIKSNHLRPMCKKHCFKHCSAKQLVKNQSLVVPYADSLSTRLENVGSYSKRHRSKFYSLGVEANLAVYVSVNTIVLNDVTGNCLQNWTRLYQNFSGY